MFRKLLIGFVVASLFAITGLQQSNAQTQLTIFNGGGGSNAASTQWYQQGTNWAYKYNTGWVNTYWQVTWNSGIGGLGTTEWAAWKAFPSGVNCEVWTHVPHHPNATMNADYRIFNSAVSSGGPLNWETHRVDQTNIVGPYNPWFKVGTTQATCWSLTLYLYDNTIDLPGTTFVVYDDSGMLIN